MPPINIFLLAKNNRSILSLGVKLPIKTKGFPLKSMLLLIKIPFKVLPVEQFYAPMCGLT